MQDRLFVVCYTIRGEKFRIISLRKANKREEQTYEKRPPLTDKDGEVRELTYEDMKLFKPIAEVHPELIEAMQRLKNRGGRPKAESPKVHVGFRMAADIVAGIKATGKGYNARVEKILREALERGKL